MYNRNGSYYFRKTIQQFFSYALIGVLTNILGYVFYLLLAQYSGAPKLSMTIVYSSAVMISFIANRRITFRHGGHIGSTGLRYLVVQILGYLLNLLMLILFVDWLDFPHQVVQGISIVLVAIFLFIMLKIVVFVPYIARGK